MEKNLYIYECVNEYSFKFKDLLKGSQNFQESLMYIEDFISSERVAAHTNTQREHLR